VAALVAADVLTTALEAAGVGVLADWILTEVQANQLLDDLTCTLHNPLVPVQVTAGTVKVKVKVLTLPPFPKETVLDPNVLPPVGSIERETAPCPSAATTCQVILACCPTVQVAADAVGAVPPPQGLDLEACVFQARGVFNLA